MVKQVRVIRNVSVIAILFAGVLWLVRNHISANPDAILVGGLGGICYGWLYWWRLSRRVSRRNRRFGQNKIFVQFLSVFELALVAAASSHYILIVLALLILAGAFVGIFSEHWWTVLAGSFGIAAAASLGISIIRYESRHGPLYYQYDSRAWLGGEGLLYQVGQVVERLAPTGRVTVNGEVWNAVSMSGDAIETGQDVEVIARDGLTLYVDRLPSGNGSGSTRKVVQPAR